MSNDARDALDLLASRRGLLLAVSGGPDSVALMLLCASWPLRAAHDIAVATVDHGLRAESRDEAENVGDWARKLGFPHHVLSWRGEKPTTRIQERAREARYRLLAACAQEIGAQAIVTAHHADDQAETILFRLIRGSGVAGLAGMPTESRVAGVALLRPLLSLSKQALVDICDAAGHPYVVDPSNADEAYARARLRRLRPLLAAEGFDAAALLRLGARAARAEAALAACATQAHDEALRASGADFARFDSEALRALPLELLQRLLNIEISRLAPESQARLDRLERVADQMHVALKSGRQLKLTLAGIAIEAGSGEVSLRPAPPRRAAKREAGGGA